MTVTGGPVAIGGIGGSGTRVVAALLRQMGHYIGSDLNPALDNLWFTLLFKRRSVLLESDRDFAWLCDQFWMRMTGAPDVRGDSLERIARLAAPDRMAHSWDWYRQRAATWKDAPPVRASAWGWKEPNTHLVIDRMFALRPDLRYIHVLRNPLDMALSSNQNQLKLWGAILLDRAVAEGPEDSLSYGCAVARRIMRIADDHPGRICMVEFERLCDAPASVARQIADFIGAPVGDDIPAWFSDIVEQGAPAIGRHRHIPPDMFAPDDLHFVATLGYAVD
ncbi:hypothetical protein DM806_19115 [Sphingobium lactosutens]|uniref:sulfotransferase family protein n=1 Tax=Sphingobium lactosutens TaxID=522773 RepID=UPI0015BD7734|nr:sulfotransferase [Sphingobium lactosutens]NWK97726.1 hypothetical protein [Sphingobium lactosutens]